MFTRPSKKLLGRADEGHREAQPFNQSGHSREELGIGDVRAVPGQEVVDAVDGSDSDVKGVRQGLGRKKVLRDDIEAELLRRLRQLENGDVGQQSHSARDGLRVAPAGFLDDERGHEKLEVPLARPPPVLSYLLVPGNDEVSRRSRGEVADDGCFEVNACGHADMLAPGAS